MRKEVRWTLQKDGNSTATHGRYSLKVIPAGAFGYPYWDIKVGEVVHAHCYQHSPIGKGELNGRVQAERVLYTLLKTNEEPLHEHDCSKCIYLGSDEDTDYYYHPNDEELLFATLIARYGQHGDYSSGTEFIMSSVGLNKALKMGYEKGLLPNPYLQYCYRKQQEWFDYCKDDQGYAEGIAKRWEGLERFILPDPQNDPK